MFRKVNTDGDKQHLQNDLDRLVKWYEKWQMLLNFWKYKCLHTGHGNLDVNYKMGGILKLLQVTQSNKSVLLMNLTKVCPLLFNQLFIYYLNYPVFTHYRCEHQKA